MENCTNGYHTFSFFQKLTAIEWFELSIAFDEYRRKYNKINKSPIEDEKKSDKPIGWEYAYKNRQGKGIRWQLFSIPVKNGFTIHGVMVIITPKVLLENDYFSAATERDLEKVADIFNREAARISPILLDFGLCSVSRADPCVNINLNELDIDCSPEEILKLIKRGNIPNHYTKRKIYDKKSRRMVPEDDCFYLSSGSANFNCYLKNRQAKIKLKHLVNNSGFHNGVDLRFEMQLRYPALYSTAKKVKEKSKYYKDADDISFDEMREIMIKEIKNPSIPIDIVFSEILSTNTIKKYFYKVARKGDYFTLEGAKWMIGMHDFRRDKKDRLIKALELTKKHQGIANAKSNLQDRQLEEYKKSLRDLDDILVNPITIPRRWKPTHIPNPIRTYYEKTTDVIWDSKDIFFHELLKKLKTWI